MKIIINIILFSLAYSGYGQAVTFNKRVQIGCASTIISGLEATDSCYYATGFVLDSLNCTSSTVFIKFDTSSSLLTSKTSKEAL